MAGPSTTKKRLRRATTKDTNYAETDDYDDFIVAEDDDESDLAPVRPRKLRKCDQDRLSAEVAAAVAKEEKLTRKKARTELRKRKASRAMRHQKIARELKTRITFTSAELTGTRDKLKREEIKKRLEVQKAELKSLKDKISQMAGSKVRSRKREMRMRRDLESELRDMLPVSANGAAVDSVEAYRRFKEMARQMSIEAVMDRHKINIVSKREEYGDVDSINFGIGPDGEERTLPFDIFKIVMTRMSKTWSVRAFWNLTLVCKGWHGVFRFSRTFNAMAEGVRMFHRVRIPAAHVLSEDFLAVNTAALYMAEWIDMTKTVSAIPHPNRRSCGARILSNGERCGNKVIDAEMDKVRSLLQCKFCTNPECTAQVALSVVTRLPYYSMVSSYDFAGNGQTNMCGRGSAVFVSAMFAPGSYFRRDLVYLSLHTRDLACALLACVGGLPEGVEAAFPALTTLTFSCAAITKTGFAIKADTIRRIAPPTLQVFKLTDRARVSPAVLMHVPPVDTLVLGRRQDNDDGFLYKKEWGHPGGSQSGPESPGQRSYIVTNVRTSLVLTNLLDFLDPVGSFPHITELLLSFRLYVCKDEEKLATGLRRTLVACPNLKILCIPELTEPIYMAFSRLGDDDMTGRLQGLTLCCTVVSDRMQTVPHATILGNMNVAGVCFLTMSDTMKRNWVHGLAERVPHETKKRATLLLQEYFV